MQPIAIRKAARRYQSVEIAKASGATYTPNSLARFVAARIVENADLVGLSAIKILDPAIGDGELVLALLDVLKSKTKASVSVYGFDTNVKALNSAAQRIRKESPGTTVALTCGDFLDYALETNNHDSALPLFATRRESKHYDLIIANPPYVRIQILGSERAQLLADNFGLTGRVDLYQAFLLGIAQVLSPNGAAGIIASNRFMTTKGGSTLRSALRQRFDLRQIWDLGDTKLFGAAVLPAVLIARGTASPTKNVPNFTSIYEDKGIPSHRATDALDALAYNGIVEINDGRRFSVRQGVLDGSGHCSDVWRLASASGDEWLATVDRYTWKRFGEIGKIRVGVKTCADKVFIRHDWHDVLGDEKPELLRPLITHHAAGRFRAVTPKKDRQILYPHEVIQGRRQSIPLESYPKTLAYLESHRETLENRSYLMEAGRRWYELWVPQDPEAWSLPKLVFRDISERPTFWLDMDGSIVNGDCYWLVASHQEESDLLWLAAAVANSTFAEAFYDRSFNNKLYAGRRRFITQYVERFPLPNPALPLSKEIIVQAKAIFEINHAPDAHDLERGLDKLVWQAFGLRFEEIGG